ncbi:hypothetical protein BASA81_015433 [Batrachochytrium salamandrivorans]|nr:hypothetical protein BASA81_015433 [Batrachochytrium salamandrivorans]
MPRNLPTCCKWGCSFPNSLDSAAVAESRLLFPPPTCCRCCWRGLCAVWGVSAVIHSPSSQLHHREALALSKETFSDSRAMSHAVHGQKAWSRFERAWICLGRERAAASASRSSHVLRGWNGGGCSAAAADDAATTAVGVNRHVSMGYPKPMIEVTDSCSALDNRFSLDHVLFESRPSSQRPQVRNVRKCHWGVHYRALGRPDGERAGTDACHCCAGSHSCNAMRLAIPRPTTCCRDEGAIPLAVGRIVRHPGFILRVVLLRIIIIIGSAAPIPKFINALSEINRRPCGERLWKSSATCQCLLGLYNHGAHCKNGQQHVHILLHALQALAPQELESHNLADFLLPSVCCNRRNEISSVTSANSCTCTILEYDPNTTRPSWK